MQLPCSSGAGEEAKCDACDAPNGCQALCVKNASGGGSCTAWSYNHQHKLCFLKGLADFPANATYQTSTGKPTASADTSGRLWSATISNSPTPNHSPLPPSPPPPPPPPSGKGAGGLKWLGCSDDYIDQYKGALNMLAENSDISTAVHAKQTLGLPSFWGDSCFPGATNCSGSGGPVMGPHGCLKNGGCWKLADDWETEVVAKVASIKPLIANQTVVGIAMGDEMCVPENMISCVNSVTVCRVNVNTGCAMAFLSRTSQRS